MYPSRKEVMKERTGLLFHRDFSQIPFEMSNHWHNYVGNMRHPSTRPFLNRQLQAKEASETFKNLLTLANKVINILKLKDYYYQYVEWIPYKEHPDFPGKPGSEYGYVDYRQNFDTAQELTEAISFAPSSKFEVFYLYDSNVNGTGEVSLAPTNFIFHELDADGTETFFEIRLQHNSMTRMVEKDRAFIPLMPPFSVPNTGMDTNSLVFITQSINSPLYKTVTRHIQKGFSPQKVKESENTMRMTGVMYDEHFNKATPTPTSELYDYYELSDIRRKACFDNAVYALNPQGEIIIICNADMTVKSAKKDGLGEPFINYMHRGMIVKFVLYAEK